MVLPSGKWIVLHKHILEDWTHELYVTSNNDFQNIIEIYYKYDKDKITYL